MPTAKSHSPSRLAFNHTEAQSETFVFKFTLDHERNNTTRKQLLISHLQSPECSHQLPSRRKLRQQADPPALAPALALALAATPAGAGAIMFGLPSKEVQDAMVAGKPISATLTAPVAGAWELTIQQGGLPILKDGKVIGAIGCGGSASANDEKFAQAGIDALSGK